MRANGIGFTYDDVILLPGYINFGTDKVSLKSKLTRNVTLNAPFVSAPMDTVTEHKMAIGMALSGGIGIIHYNMPEDDQVSEIRRVKLFRNGFILEPVCVKPDMTIEELIQLSRKVGFTGFPVTETGKMNSKLLGVVTTRDFDFVLPQEIKTKRVSDVMTTELIVGKDPITLRAANEIMIREKKG